MQYLIIQYKTNMSNKKHNLSTHKIATLTYLLINELNDIKANSFLAKEIIDKGKDLELALEPMLEAVFQSKQISKGTYLNQMGHQIDTVIRKNYTMITE
jgi:hypothetical protein